MSIGTTAFREKPSPNQVSEIYFSEQNVTANDLITYINNGHPFCAQFKHEGNLLKPEERRGQNSKKGSNFISIPYICFDFDHKSLNMTDFLPSLNIFPTIAYTTPSNGKNNEFAYRLIYFLDKPITGENEYKRKYQGLLNSLGLQGEDDKKCKDAIHYFNGSFDCSYEVFPNNIIFTDNIQEADEPTEEPTQEINSANNTNLNIHTIGTHNNMMYNEDSKICTALEREFSKDWKKMTLKEILYKYRDVYGDWAREKADYNERGIAYDYIDLDWNWTIDERGRKTIKKVQKGCRDNVLFGIGVKIRVMNPSIDLNGLCYALSEMVVYYFDNSDGEITKQRIKAKSLKILEIPTDELPTQYQQVHKFKVSSEMARLTGKSKQKLAAEELQYIKDNEILKLFEPLKTDKENREILKGYDIRVSPEYLKVFRVRHNLKQKDVQLQMLLQFLQQGMSDTEIRELLHVSRRTFYTLKKECRKYESVSI